MAALMLVSLSGCSADAYANISNPDDVIVTVGDSSITAGDVYKLMKNENIVPIILTDNDKRIFDEYVTLTEEQEAEIEASFNDTVTSYGGEEYFEYTLQQYGYPSLESYKDELYNTAKTTELIKVYARENLDEYTAEYAPKMIQTMGFSDMDTANQALELMANGMSFEEAAAELDYTASIEPKIATNYSTDIPSVIIVALTATIEPGLIRTTFTDTDNNIYYVVNVTDVDPANFEDEFIDMLSTDSTISTDVLVHYYDEMNFHVYDKDLYDRIAAEYPDYLVQE